ncbi:MAG: DUF3108 domain-containing protein [Bacteroidales bacterium]|nr:DUF3108 domain-containing protein [Bacteroidales bacterium]MCF8391956.1 DUF3108 domain-containing protein [Bacteroidales bacterium]
MRKILCILFLLPLFSTSHSQVGQNHFKGGEKLRFIIYYGILDGGYIDAELNLVNFEGHKAYHSKMLAQTTGLTDKLYRVRDEYQAYFDPITILPYKSVRNISEGKYRKYNEVSYDYDSLKATNIKGEVFDITPDIRDMVSVFHLIRNKDFDELKPGDIIKINTFFDDELFPFDMRYRGIETIKTRIGTFECIKLVPYVEPGRIFNSEDDMTIWLSADMNKVPIRVKFDLKVGSVKVDLIDYSGLKY